MRASASARRTRLSTGPVDRLRAGTYQRVTDSRKRPIGARWTRSGSYYARLTVEDPAAGRKQARRVPSASARYDKSGRARLPRQRRFPPAAMPRRRSTSDDEPSAAPRSADSHVRANPRRGTRGQGCPRSGLTAVLDLLPSHSTRSLLCASGHYRHGSQSVTSSAPLPRRVSPLIRLSRNAFDG